MTEVQSHGFSFEQWIRDTLFSGYSGNYGQKWDVPPDANASPSIPPAWRSLAVSIKTSKYGSPIGLGDILRQRQIDLPFLMIVGFWHQRTAEEKWIEDIGVAHFSVPAWSDMWGELTLSDLRAIDTVIKDLSVHHQTVREKARAWKEATAALKTAVFVVNPKIDSKSQRRIQCSLPFHVFWRKVGREPTRSNAPELFGHSFPNPIRSSARSFNA